MHSQAKSQRLQISPNQVGDLQSIAAARSNAEPTPHAKPVLDAQRYRSCVGKIADQKRLAQNENHVAGELTPRVPRSER